MQYTIVSEYKPQEVSINFWNPISALWYLYLQESNIQKQLNMKSFNLYYN